MRRRNHHGAETETQTFLLVRIQDSDDNWPAQVDLVRSRIAVLASELGEEGSLLERSLPRECCFGKQMVEFLTTSDHVWDRWHFYQRLRGYREQLINGHLTDLKGMVPRLTGVPETLGVASAIVDAVERGHTVILRSRDDGAPPVVIRSAIVDVTSGTVAVAESRGSAALGQPLDLRRFAAAEVLDW